MLKCVEMNREWWLHGEKVLEYTTLAPLLRKSSNQIGMRNWLRIKSSRPRLHHVAARKFQPDWNAQLAANKAILHSCAMLLRESCALLLFTRAFKFASLELFAMATLRGVLQ